MHFGKLGNHQIKINEIRNELTHDLEIPSSKITLNGECGYTGKLLKDL